MTAFEAIQIARKYNLEAEVRQERLRVLTPKQALEEWDILLNNWDTILEDKKVLMMLIELC